ncbi:hypothetical protein CNMCM7691_004833 [Aspergillus felis]|uniref:Mitochondrial division protein 1 n=1 Tax=Aspergillus felis TaxID=1287682 RepID=A0A8H6R414_9EURO|nr:hypothetical protein CNMCM7691_004833 [Aspergillus felis]
MLGIHDAGRRKMNITNHQDVLAQIREWRRGNSDSCPIFHVSAPTREQATGIAHSVASSPGCQDYELYPSIFLSNSAVKTDVLSVDLITACLSIQLGQRFATTVQSNSVVREAATNLLNYSLRHRWQTLFAELLAAMALDPQWASPVLVVLDGLESLPDIDKFFTVIGERVSATSPGPVVPLRFLVTSLAGSSLTKALSLPLGWCRSVALPYATDRWNISLTTEEIRELIRYCLEPLGDAPDELENAPELRRIDIDRLVAYSSNSAERAAAACLYIRLAATETEQWQRLEYLLRKKSNISDHSLLQTLHELYQTSQQSPDAIADQIAVLPILGMALGAYTSIYSALEHANCLVWLMDIFVDNNGHGSRVMRALEPLLEIVRGHNSELNTRIRDTIRQSLLIRDWSTLPDSHVGPWIPSEPQIHALLTQRCLDLLMRSDCLKRDICNLQDPSTMLKDIDRHIVQRCLPGELRYACRYAASHLLRCTFQDQVHLSQMFCQFFQRKLLPWLEAMSLMGLEHEIVWILSTVEKILDMAEDRRYHTFVHHARMFACEHMEMIEEAPLQIYSSGLLFTPHESSIRQWFEPDILTQGVQVLPEIEPPGRTNRPASILCHAQEVTTLIFIPTTTENSIIHGKHTFLLASASVDRSIRLWDPVTAELTNSLWGHSGEVTKIALRPCSPRRMLASLASGDLAVRLWDVEDGQGKSIHVPHRRHSETICFSSDGQRLYSFSSEGTILAIDVESGKCSEVLKGVCGNWGTFSPDGTAFVAVTDHIFGSMGTSTDANLYDEPDSEDDDDGDSSDEDIASDRSIRSSDNDSDSYEDSDDDRGNDCILQIWSLETGKVKVKKRFSTPVCGATFSPDCSMLAVASLNNPNVTLFTVGNHGGRKSRVGHELKGRLPLIRSLEFSPDSKMLASALPARTVCVWDVRLRRIQREFSHPDEVHLVIFSPNCKMIASVSCDSTIYVWDLQTSNLLSIFRGQWGTINTLVFYPDSTRLASAGSDGDVRIWHIEPAGRSELLCTPCLKHHSHQITDISFSVRARRIVSTSQMEALRVWDADKGYVEKSLGSHLDGITHTTLAPDGTQLAAISKHGTVQLWDLTTDQVLKTFGRSSDKVFNAVFSDNGLRLFLFAVNGSVRVWNARLGILDQQVPLDTQSRVTALSADGDHLASSSSSPDKENCVQLWSVERGCVQHTFDVPLPITALAISPNSAYLASGHAGRICVWNIPAAQLHCAFDMSAAPTVTALRYAPESEKLVYALDDQTLWTYDLHSGRQGKTLDANVVRAFEYLSESLGNRVESLHSVDMTGKWVTRNGRKLLRLPRNRMPSAPASRGTTIAADEKTLIIGAKTGKVTILRFGLYSSA